MPKVDNDPSLPTTFLSKILHPILYEYEYLVSYALPTYFAVGYLLVRYLKKIEVENAFIYLLLPNNNQNTIVHYVETDIIDHEKYFIKDWTCRSVICPILILMLYWCTCEIHVQTGIFIWVYKGFSFVRWNKLLYFNVFVIKIFWCVCLFANQLKQFNLTVVISVRFNIE